MRHQSGPMACATSKQHALGYVVRPYEIPTSPKWRTVVHDSNDWWSKAYEPKDGKLDVLAACMVHFTRQTVEDLKAGLAAPCRSCDG